MKIRERQLTYAFALIENAKQTLYTAAQFLGNLPYGKDGDVRNDILTATRDIEDIRIKINDIMDMNTDWSRNQDLVREIPGEVKIGGDEK